MKSIIDAAEILLLLPGQLNREQKDWLWEQQVDMDDVNFILFIPPEMLEADEYSELLKPKSWVIEDLCLGRCQSSRWHIVEFGDGIKRGVGVSYH